MARFLNNSVMRNIQMFTLANEKIMPMIGLGTSYPLDQHSIVQETLQSALDCGYRHIDTAYLYGTERLVSGVLKEQFTSGKLKREDVFVTTKLWPTFMGSAEYVRQGVKLSLDNLGLDYVDLYLLHAPTVLKYKNLQGYDLIPPLHEVEKEFINGANLFLEAWKVLEEFVNQGKFKAIGVSNFNIRQLRQIKEISTYPIACNQVECHIYLQQHDLVEYCQNENIAVVAFAPLGSPGRKTDRGGWSIHAPLEEPIVQSIAKKYGKSEAQILLKFLLQRGISVIPKSIKPARLQENSNVFDFTLAKEDISSLKSLDRNERSFPWDVVKGHSEYPF